MVDYEFEGSNSLYWFIVIDKTTAQEELEIIKEELI